MLQVYLSPRQDDFVVVFVNGQCPPPALLFLRKFFHPGEHCACLEVPLKTEFVTTLSKKYKEKTGRELKFHFDDL